MGWMSQFGWNQDRKVAKSYSKNKFNLVLCDESSLKVVFFSSLGMCDYQAVQHLKFAGCFLLAVCYQPSHIAACKWMAIK